MSRNVNRRSLTVVIIALTGTATSAGLNSGCSSALETGYEPRKLGAGPAERRGFYSPRFSPEARAAQAERAEGGGGGIDRRPTLGPDAGQ